MNRDRLTTFAWATLAFSLLVIVWGAYVRATGAGAGCGSHWPLCNGEVVPRSPSAETMIEYTHRLTSGVALLLVAALAVWIFRAFGRGHPARLGAVLSVVFILIEAAIGAGLVLLELVGGNESLARAAYIAVHLGNTLLLVAALTLTAYWTGGGAAIRWRRGRFGRLAALALAGTILVGTSGAVTALGDTLFPLQSLAEELRQDFSPATPLLKQLRIFHPLIAVLVSLVLLRLIAEVRMRRPPAAAKRYVNWLHLLVFVQLVMGTLNILLKAPVWMQLVHLLLADLLWMALVLTLATVLAEREPATPAVPAVAAVT